MKTWVVGTLIAWSGVVTTYSLYGVLRNFLYRMKKTSEDEENAATTGKKLAEHYARNDDSILHPCVRPKLSEALLYQQKVAELCFRHYKGKNHIPHRALVVGCGAGGVAFELGGFFNKVVAVDKSANFISICHQLKQYGKLVYSVADEGEITSEHIALVDPLLDRSKVHFGHEDASSLPLDLGKFGCVFIGGALIQMNNPKRFLRDIAEYIYPGGFLVISLDYSSLEKNTLECNTNFSGYKDYNGYQITGFRALQLELKESFRMVEATNLLRVSRLEQRIYHIRVSHVTVWQLNSNDD